MTSYCPATGLHLGKGTADILALWAPSMGGSVFGMAKGWEVTVTE